MQKEKALRNIKFAALILLCILASSLVTYAAIQYLWPVTNTAQIVAVYGIKLVKDVAPYTDEVASISWGNLLPAAVKNSTIVIGARLRLRNADNMEVWASWNIAEETPLPSGVTVSAWRWYDAGPPSEWLAGFNAGADPPDIPHGTVYLYPIEFRITTAAGTPAQAFSFTIQIKAHDSGSG